MKLSLPLAWFRSRWCGLVIVHANTKPVESTYFWTLTGGGSSQFVRDRRILSNNLALATQVWRQLNCHLGSHEGHHFGKREGIKYCLWRYRKYRWPIHEWQVVYIASLSGSSTKVFWVYKFWINTKEESSYFTSNTFWGKCHVLIIEVWCPNSRSR